MKTLRKLAGQTAIYGLSSILGRFLNYLLTPLWTDVYSPDQYGIITEMYSYVAFLVVFLTYGMETAFFRFSTKESSSPKDVFTTAVVTLMSSTALFIFFAMVFRTPIANWLMYPNNTEFVVWFAIIVGLDAVSSIPLAQLRAQNKAKTFAIITLTNVIVNIGLNIFFLFYCLPAYKSGHTNFLIDTFYNPNIGVGYVFISNLIASIIKFILLTPYMLNLKGRVSLTLLKKMLYYALPLLIAGLAGIVNETIDRLLLKRMLIGELGEIKTMTLIGIYGGCYKISIIITLFIQAFRYAAEPFFFSQEKSKNVKDTYIRVMNYFVIVCSVIFLTVLLYLDIFKNFVPNEAYWVGLKVVPILLAANICLGIYYNQSIWYKLSGKTYYGSYIAIIGALITLGLNLIFIPYYNYMASAWATLICYASMMIISYYMGKKHYPIEYNVKKALGYIGLAVLFYFVSTFINTPNLLVFYGERTLLLMLFFAIIILVEKNDIVSLIKSNDD